MRRLVPFLLAAAVAVAVLWLQSDHGVRSLTWRAVDRDLAARYPGLPSTTPERLAARLAAPEPPLLLDARTPAEVAVSHLPGARRIDPDADAAGLAVVLGEVDPSREIVVYCSVGVRSARVAQRLRRAGFENVEALDGSIFRWANQGRPLVRAREPVEVVHPYNAVWGQLLDPSRRADLR